MVVYTIYELTLFKSSVILNNMVYNTYIKCNTCGTPIRLRIQMDGCVYRYDLPIHICCPNPDCGDEFDCHFNHKQGILPRWFVASEKDMPKHSISYSPQLPISSDIKYGVDQKFILTPFMALGMLYTPPKVSLFGKYMQTILKEVYPYRTLLRDLIPMLKKGNVMAFQKKMMKIMELEGNKRDLSSVKECHDAYSDFVESLRRSFSSSEYVSIVSGDVFDNCERSIQLRPKDDLQALMVVVKQSTNIQKWREDAMRYLGAFLEHSEKYYPVMFFIQMGDIAIPHAVDFMIDTIDVDSVHADFSKSFNLLNDILSLPVGLCNMELTGDFNTFPNADNGMKGIHGLSEFAKLPDGLKVDKLSDYGIMDKYLADCFNSHVRNGIAHENAIFNTDTQMIEYYYKMNDNETHEDYRLIDVAIMTFVNTLHVMEMFVMLNKISNKL